MVKKEYAHKDDELDRTAQFEDSRMRHGLKDEHGRGSVVKRAMTHSPIRGGRRRFLDNRLMLPGQDPHLSRKHNEFCLWWENVFMASSVAPCVQDTDWGWLKSCWPNAC